MLDDVDRDGRLDLIATNWNYEALSVYRNRGDGRFAAPTRQPTGHGPTRLANGDFDGDGVVDLAVLSGAMVNLLRGDGAGGFAPYESLATANFGWSLNVGDLDGDATLDLAIWGGADVTVLFNQSRRCR